MSEVRVRYAPSPTGDLHIGNARTALFNYLFAKSQNGKFILRIEDTDTARNVAGGEQSQMNYLRWLGIEWDESVDIGGDYGPYRQLERLDIYQQYAEALIEKGLAYKCYCTSEELEAQREQLEANDVANIHYSRRCLTHPPTDRTAYAIRFKVPTAITYTFTDLVRGDISFESSDIGDWVIMKANGIPTYNFACAVDDHLMKITHIFRGEEHITNTPKQLMIYDAFNWEHPTYAHLTLIVNEAGKKLSKRDADTVQFIEQYAKMGYLPEGMFNFIALLGHAPVSDSEVLTEADIIKTFDVQRLSKSPSTFDRAKLAFINAQHLKTLDEDARLELCMPHLIDADVLVGKAPTWAAGLVNLFADRLTYGEEIVDLYDTFFDADFSVDVEAKDFLISSREATMQTLTAFKAELEGLANFTTDAVKNAIKAAGVTAGVKGKNLFMPCRIGISGAMHGPDLPALVTLLGRDVVLDRLKAVIKEL
ncbi:MAG: glutamate--tRNA ligase [Defluviitaleaceae bacterium]|nr:glutamate--tRNA ligase [Defluviitaleaceae bacterium]